MQEVLISDGTGTLSLVFFNQPYLAEAKYPNALVPGRRGLFSGKVRLYKGMRQLAHPQHQLFTEEGQEPPDKETDPEGAATRGFPPVVRRPSRDALGTRQPACARALSSARDPEPVEEPCPDR